MNKILKRSIDHWDRRLRINIEKLPPEGIDQLPTKLLPFMWFFIKQVKGPVLTIAITEGIFAVLISVMFWYVGELVGQAQYAQATLWLGAALLLLRFVVGTLAEIFYHLVYTPYVGNMIRRQLYWYTARQSLAFFQNDFAGRIANKLLQSAPRLRDVVKSTIGSVLFAATFTVSNLWFLSTTNFWLAVPLVFWLVGYVTALWYFVPKVQKRSSIHAEDMSTLTGQVVDSFTNFLPTKYFARTEHEDNRVVGLLNKHSGSFRDLTATIWFMSFIIDIMNTALLVATALIGFWLIDTQGQAGLAAIAMALPMALQATFQSGWIMYEVSGIFEGLGTVQEGIDALSKVHDVTDDKKASRLTVDHGQASIVFKDVTFKYSPESDPVFENFNLVIPAGQKVGLVGTSGAGKSTLTSMLVRAYDIDGGQILINDQDIATVQQESLRENITVVTQESYLFHRSVLDNICYGKPDAKMSEVIAAAKQASAHDFILGLEDNKGRQGYKAHVGERGVKLSGGQKQRVGIARAILKDAPILILDEATSALDSESEHAIQHSLENIMEGKTVIAVAHRLSTLRQMDRILVLEHGRIIEDGSHDELIAKPNGRYAKLWSMQSGGFLAED